MSGHVEEQIPELVLGGLDDETRARVEAHVAGCASCRAERRAVEEALALYLESLAIEGAPEAPRLRLMESVRGEGTLVDKIVRLFDLAREQATKLLDQLADRASWVPGPLPGMQLYHFTPGPRMAGVDAGLIFFPGNMTFPVHKHLGEEQMLVVQGGFRELGGAHYGVGELLSMPADSAHSFVMDPEGCVAAVSLRVGIEVEGMGKLYVHDFKKE